MKATKVLLYLNIFTTLTATRKVLSSGSAAKGITWRFVQSGDFIGSLNGLVQAGLESKESGKTQRPLYICRAWRDSVWTPGKLILVVDRNPDKCGLTCFIVDTSNSNEVAFKITLDNLNLIQLLETSSGWTTWIPHKPSDPFPANFISGGYNSKGDQTPICRTQDDEGYVNVGKYWQYSSECIYSDEGGIHRVTKDVEILVLDRLEQIV